MFEGFARALNRAHVKDLKRETKDQFWVEKTIILIFNILNTPFSREYLYI